MHRRGRPTASDVLLAAALLVANAADVALGGVNGSNGLLVIVSALAIVPLAWRRVAPGVVAMATCAALLIPALLATPADGLALLAANLVAVHSVTVYGGRRLGPTYALAIVVCAGVDVASQPQRQPGDLVWTVALYGLAAASGTALAAYARNQQRQQEEAEKQRVETLRRTLAADLHDSVAHGVALMVVQAGAAAAILDSDPDRARQLLNRVQEAGEMTAAALDQMLSVLVGVEHAENTPTAADLPALVESFAATDHVIALQMASGADQLPAGVSTVAFRVVQEALTNAWKHAPNQPVAVAVDLRADHARVEVINPLPTVAPRPESARSGHGINAMRNRVEGLGGALTVGPWSDGWRVLAEFPLSPGGSA